jgi:RecJ-like exonuclease
MILNIHELNTNLPGWGLEYLSRDGRGRHLVTRGNVDGIVSAALYLSVFPCARLSFITSPKAAARAVSMDQASDELCLVDVALTPDVLEAMECSRRARRFLVVDHHPSTKRGENRFQVAYGEGVSAANVLYHHLQASQHLKKLVAIADMIEYCGTDVVREVGRKHGLQRLDEESKILDFSWRLEIDDDAFRASAARHLGQGAWPSQVDSIRMRYVRVLNENRWPKALARIRSGIHVRDGIGIFRNDDHNRSLYGFGTRALVEVASRRGCEYALMMNDRRESCSISLRRMSPDGVDLGTFVEEFTRSHGLDGGGHRTAAGARIPSSAGESLIESLLHQTA